MQQTDDTTDDTTAEALAGTSQASGAAARPRPGLVAFTGTGPGDTGLLTLRAAELLGQADVVAGSPELTGRLAHLVPGAATVIDTGQSGADPEVLITAAGSGQLVVRLCPGDPLLFAQAVAEADACAQAGVRLEIVPGMPAATAVPAYAGLPLTGESAGELRIVHTSKINKMSTEFQTS